MGNKLELRSGEAVITTEKAQLAEGFPQTAGPLYLTNERLVLVPNQLQSLGRGKRLEIPLSRIRSINKLGRFEGGTHVGGAGRKVAVTLDDSSEFTFSFFLLANIDAFYRSLARQLNLPVANEEDEPEE